MKNALAMLCAGLLITGCQTQGTGPNAVSSKIGDGSPARFCQVFEPISYDSGVDSAETVNQVRRMNAAWDAICKG